MGEWRQGGTGRTGALWAGSQHAPTQGALPHTPPPNPALYQPAPPIMQPRRTPPLPAVPTSTSFGLTCLVTRLSCLGSLSGMVETPTTTTTTHHDHPPCTSRSHHLESMMNSRSMESGSSCDTSRASSEGNSTAQREGSTSRGTSNMLAGKEGRGQGGLQGCGRVPAESGHSCFTLDRV